MALDRYIWGGVGILLLIIGGVWFFQGIGSLQGSPMTGVSFWAFAGVAVFIVGAVLLWLLSRCGPRSSED